MSSYRGLKSSRAGGAQRGAQPGARDAMPALGHRAARRQHEAASRKSGYAIYNNDGPQPVAENMTDERLSKKCISPVGPNNRHLSAASREAASVRYRRVDQTPLAPNPRPLSATTVQQPIVMIYRCVRLSELIWHSGDDISYQQTRAAPTISEARRRGAALTRRADQATLLGIAVLPRLRLPATAQGTLWHGR